MTRPRYLFMAMPSPSVRAGLAILIQRYGVDKLLGGSLFVPTNWHQSLSDRHWEDSMPDLRGKLMRAGARVSAHAVPMTLNRIVAHGAHWSFQAKGKPAGFVELLNAIRAALSAEGIDDRIGHTPHVTVSYTAPDRLIAPKIREAVEWIIDEVLLVKGGGSPYHYEVLGRWPLHTIPGGAQQQLF